MIVVGHTPGDNVRLSCGGRLIASDSSLSRYFDRSGNRYCPTTAASTTVGECAQPLGDCRGSIAKVEWREGSWQTEALSLNFGIESSESVRPVPPRPDDL